MAKVVWRLFLHYPLNGGALGGLDFDKIEAGMEGGDVEAVAGLR